VQELKTPRQKKDIDKQTNLRDMTRVLGVREQMGGKVKMLYIIKLKDWQRFSVRKP